MISEKNRTRNQTITLRVTPSERELFLRGAEKRNMTLTDFLVSAALYTNGIFQLSLPTLSK